MHPSANDKLPRDQKGAATAGLTATTRPNHAASWIPNYGGRCGSTIRTRACAVCSETRCEVHRRCYHFKLAHGPVSLQGRIQVHGRDTLPLPWWLPATAPDEYLVMELHNNHEYRWTRRPNATQWFLTSYTSDREPRNPLSWKECVDRPELWLAELILWRENSMEHLFHDFSAMRACMNRFWKTNHNISFTMIANALMTIELPSVLLGITVQYLPPLAVDKRFRQRNLMAAARKIIRKEMNLGCYRQTPFPSQLSEDRNGRLTELANLLPHLGAERVTTFIANDIYFYYQRFLPALELGIAVRNEHCDTQCHSCRRKGHTHAFCPR